MTINNLLDKVKSYNTEANFELIKKAYYFAEKAHRGQKRKSGENYIIHPLHAAYYLAEMKLSSVTIAAALLHDVVDDTDVSLTDIQKNFGKEIAFLVDGVGRLGKIKYRGIERQVENLRKLFLAMAKDIRVILIKLCDRRHNLETLCYLPDNKQKRIAKESIEIYAPLAYRLGIGELKGRLEDLAFPYAYPQEHQELISRVKDKYEERKKYLKKVKAVIEKKLKKERIPIAELHFRAKHYYSLYQKLKRYDNDLSKIYDLVALRIIVKDIKECYRVLGLIHRIWRPLPGRIKDYIALPKPNGYKSLHTTVFCLGGRIIEFQIRTLQMHKEAELGIASHWYYSEQKGLKNYIKRKITTPPERKLAWIKQLKDWQEKSKDVSPDRYLESLKIDFLNNRIFILTPKGEAIDLPEGACAIDFAYAIHTQIGNRCAGAKSNGKIIPLSQALQNGDTVEIIIDKNKKPSRNWLAFVKTNLARSQIRKKLKKELGLEELTQKNIQEIPAPITRKNEPAQKTVKTKSPISLAGQTGILINLAKCCSPQPNDQIKAYITLSKGATVHKIDCKNFRKLQKKWPQKVITACWLKDEKPLNTTTLTIKAENKVGLLRDISSVISRFKINILKHQSEPLPSQNFTIIKMEIETPDSKIEKVIQQIKKVKGAIEVKKI